MSYYKVKKFTLIDSFRILYVSWQLSRVTNSPSLSLSLSILSCPLYYATNFPLPIGHTYKPKLMYLIHQLVFSFFLITIIFALHLEP